MRRISYAAHTPHRASFCLLCLPSFRENILLSTIQFACPKCEQTLRAPTAAAGKTGKCNRCSNPVKVPAARKTEVTTKATAANPISKQTKPRSTAQAKAAVDSSPPQATQPKPRSKSKNPQQEIMDLIAAELQGTVPRSSLNLPYQFTLVMVAVMMMLMPVLYCCLIAAACYGMFWYWTEILPTAMENLPRGRAMILAVMFYASPIVAGLMMILFMIKPIFFSLVLPKDSRQRSLQRASEPALFDLVDRICDATRSPRPKRIDIDNEVNASASLRRGFLSLLGKDLVLTIGAPLVAGMNTRQLTGVLAHEFGHFAQGGGMKSTYLIRTINMWFARVVYQRDRLDEMLDHAISESDFRISLLLMFGKLFVLLSRGILWCFMMVAHAISCMMSRQMEYDADRYEAFVAGSEQFKNTSDRLQALAAGQQTMYGTVMSALNDSVLLDDLPNITAAKANEVTASELKKMAKSHDEQTQSFFSTHPSDAKRIQAAKKYNAEGMFQLEIPASRLFKNFDAVCTGVSTDFYRNALGVLVDPSKLTRIEQFDPKD